MEDVRTLFFVMNAVKIKHFNSKYELDNGNKIIYNSPVIRSFNLIWCTSTPLFAFD